MVTMKNVSKQRKAAAKKAKLNSSKAAVKTPARRVLGLNSAKQDNGEWFYSLSDVESVVAGVLAELDSDPGAGITLEASDTGITLNVTPSEGDEYQVEVDLGVEGDEAASEGTESEDDGEDWDSEE